MTVVANTLVRVGDWEAAERLQRLVAEARDRTSGPGNDYTLVAENYLGNTLRSRGDLKGAEEYLRKVLKARQSMFGPDDDANTYIKVQLAKTLKARGKLKEAKELQLELKAARSGPHAARSPRVSEMIYKQKAAMQANEILDAVKALEEGMSDMPDMGMDS